MILDKTITRKVNECNRKKNKKNLFLVAKGSKKLILPTKHK